MKGDHEMTLEIYGLIHPHERSETHHADGAIIDPDYVRQVAKVYEDGGFDRALIGSSSSGPDSLQMAAFVAANTTRLGLLVAHRPGFMAPTVAARAFATLDTFAAGRVALHTISGRNEPEQRRDGDYLEKVERYRRSHEYLQILKKAWTHQGPFSHEGEFYRFENFSTDVKPTATPRIPISFAGASDAAYEVSAHEADLHMFYAQPLEFLALDIERVRKESEKIGRKNPPRIGIIVRPILGNSDEEAWARARTILDQAENRVAAGKPMMRGSKDMDPTASAGFSDARQLQHNQRSQRHDRALWTAVVGATQRGNSTALVGSPETVAEAIFDYVKIGVSTVLIHGFDPYADAIDFGRRLVPLLRAKDQERQLDGGASNAA